jgi:DNA-binding beta-propeller fold protein YncE
MSLGAQSYTNIEAIEYEPEQNRYFVSNSSSIIQRNADGSLEFFGNATASHGMEVMNGILFALSANSVRAYDLDDASTLMTLNIPGISFLNGMASDGNNRIWVTDFGTGKLFEINVSDLENPVWTEIASGLGAPNGIVFDEANNRLVFVHWNASAKIRQYDLATLEVSDLYTTSLSNIDGIDHDGEGNFYIASWGPNRISKFESTFTDAPETITVAGLSNPADICYAIETDTLAIPNSGNETVIFVGFNNGISTEDINPEPGAFQLYPNPADEFSELHFHLLNEIYVMVNLYSMDGSLVTELLNGMQPAGKQRLVVPRHRLNSGQYIMKAVAGNHTQEFILIFR